ncbi:hypothetical protein [Primorskyibacter sp. 2E233]|uniref:hypothetical protein n=1 Tax=Primorskyibacter sp. 2E233 TaxID=3413431 RepID=UPI003BF3435E
MSNFEQRAYFQLFPKAKSGGDLIYGLLYSSGTKPDGAVAMKYAVRKGIPGGKRFELRNSGSDDAVKVDFGGCKDLRFMKDTPKPALPEAIGDWSGGFQNCGTWNAPAEMTIVPAHEGNILADIEYRRSTPSKPNVIYPARNLVYGIWDADTQSFAMRTLQTVGRLRDGERVVADAWALTDLRLRFDPVSNQFTGQTKGCDYVEFNKHGDGAEAVATAAAAGDGLAGTWEGVTICRDGKRTLSLTLDNRIGDQMTGMLNVAGPTAINEGVPRLSVVARRASDNEAWQAVVASIVSGGVARTGPREFTFDQGDGKEALHFAYKGGSCSETDLQRVTEVTPSRVPTVKAAGSGLYFSNASRQQRCEAVVNWLAKAGTEYPEMSIRTDPLGTVFPRMVMLFADDDFVPLFGAPYDVMPVADRIKLAQDISQTCGSDPFYRNKLVGLSVANRGLRGSLDKPLTSFGAPAIIHAIRGTRVIRHQTEGLIGEMMAVPTLEAAAVLDQRLKAVLSDNAAALWPSERGQVQQVATERLDVLAHHEAEADFARIDALPDLDAKLDALAAIATARTAYQPYLQADHRAGVRDRAESQQAQILSPLLEPELLAIEGLNDSSASLDALEQRAEVISSRLTDVAQHIADPFLRRVDTKRQAILDAVLAGMLHELESFEADLHGLDGSASWFRDFKSVFAPYKDRIAYREAIDQFEAKRERQLTGALVQFDKDAARAAKADGDIGIDAVTRRYLSLSGDDGFPVWLEYAMHARKHL